MQFFSEDIVRKVGDPKRVAVCPTLCFVALHSPCLADGRRTHPLSSSSSLTKNISQRSWHDADDQSPALNPADPLDRPLKRGEFGITDIELRTRHIVPESEYELVDRTFRVGDVCKRGIDDVASAVVLDVTCELKLRHAISGIEVGVWVDGAEVESKPGVMLGDYVICDDWVGQVCSSFRCLYRGTNGAIGRGSL